MKVVAVIPARSGSKSVPRKNIKQLGRYPLIAYSIAVAKMSKFITQVIVTTDSKVIADISCKYGAETPFLRPAEISQDDSKDMDFFNHYLSFLKDMRAEIPEYMVHLRPTSPFREVDVVDKAIEQLLDDDSATSLRSVYVSPISPFKVFQLQGPYLQGFYPKDHRIEYYNFPRQCFPQTYIPNGYVDIIRTSTIKTGMLHGERMLGFVTGKIPDIDIAEDYEYAENVLKSGKFRSLTHFMEENFE